MLITRSDCFIIYYITIRCQFCSSPINYWCRFCFLLYVYYLIKWNNFCLHLEFLQVHGNQEPRVYHGRLVSSTNIGNNQLLPAKFVCIPAPDLERAGSHKQYLHIKNISRIHCAKLYVCDHKISWQNFKLLCIYVINNKLPKADYTVSSVFNNYAIYNEDFV